MTENKGTQRTYTKPLMMTGTGILALALLTGCSTATDPASSPADTGAATTQAATAESSATGDDTADDQGTDDSSPGTDDNDDRSDSQSPTGGTTAAVAGDDPVFAAIDALLAEHSDAIIVEIDQDDNNTVYEIEAVVGDRILDFDVTTDGAVTEDDDDNNDDDNDDIRKAREATVTAEEAARAALEGRDGSTIDSLSLDDDDNTLHWEVELDNEQGDDDDLHVDAATGAVSEGN